MAVSRAKQVTISGLDLIYRTLERTELPQVLLLTQDEGWNTILEDLHLTFDAYPESFDGLFLPANQSLVGVSSAMALDTNTAHVLYLLVNKPYQRRGLGSFLIKEVSQKFKDYNVILDAAHGKEAFYERSGFQRTDLSMETYIWSSPSDYDRPLVPASLQVKPLQDVGIEKLLVYDHKVHPTQRDFVMKVRLSSKMSDQTLSKVALSEDGNILGLAVAKHTEHGLYLGPFYADDQLVARTLLQNIHCSFGDGKKLLGFSPSKNPNFKAFMTDLGISLETVYKETRMCSRTPLVAAWEKVYCFCSNNSPGLL